MGEGLNGVSSALEASTDTIEVKVGRARAASSPPAASLLSHPIVGVV